MARPVAPPSREDGASYLWCRERAAGPMHRWYVMEGGLTYKTKSLGQGAQGRASDGGAASAFNSATYRAVPVGVRGKNARTLAPGRRQVNCGTRK